MSPEDDDAFPRAAAGLVAGCVAVVAVGLIAAGTLPRQDLVARAVAMAFVAGIAAAVIDRWWSAAGVAVFAVLVFIGFLVHRCGVLTGSPSGWPDTAVIGSAALLGYTGRWLRAAVPAASAAAREVPVVRVADGVAASGYLIDGQGCSR